MEINDIYFAKREFYQIIRDIGGVWNDSKERPNSFWLVYDSHYWIRLASTPLLLSVYYI